MLGPLLPALPSPKWPQADACFAKLEGAEAKAGPSVDAVKRMDKQPGATGTGFVSAATNHINIVSFKLLRP